MRARAQRGNTIAGGATSLRCYHLRWKRLNRCAFFRVAAFSHVWRRGSCIQVILSLPTLFCWHPARIAARKTGGDVRLGGWRNGGKTASGRRNWTGGERTLARRGGGGRRGERQAAGRMEEGAGTTGGGVPLPVAALYAILYAVPLPSELIPAWHLRHARSRPPVASLGAEDISMQDAPRGARRVARQLTCAGVRMRHGATLRAGAGAPLPPEPHGLTPICAFSPAHTLPPLSRAWRYTAPQHFAGGREGGRFALLLAALRGFGGCCFARAADGNGGAVLG